MNKYFKNVSIVSLGMVTAITSCIFDEKCDSKGTVSSGSQINLSGQCNIIDKLWAPDLNGIWIDHEGLNLSVEEGVGFSHQIDGRQLATFSLITDSVFKFDDAPHRITLNVSENANVEVWNLDQMEVVGSCNDELINFTIFPNVRYGGFAWYNEPGVFSVQVRAYRWECVRDAEEENLVCGGENKYTDAGSLLDFTGVPYLENLLVNQSLTTKIGVSTYYTVTSGSTDPQAYAGYFINGDHVASFRLVEDATIVAIDQEIAVNLEILESIAESTIEIWDLDKMEVIATSQTGEVSLNYNPEMKYGGFVWFNDKQKRTLNLRATIKE